MSAEITVNFGGIVKFFKLVHVLNALFSIISTDDGISICVNEEQQLKAPYPPQHDSLSQFLGDIG